MLLLFSREVVSDSLQPRGLQHSRLPYLSLALRACSNSSPLSQWCYPTISSSAPPFSSCPQSFPASGSFPRSQFLAKVLELQHQSFQSIFQGWFPLGLTGLILLSKGLSRVFSSTIRKRLFFSAQPSLWSNSQWLIDTYSNLCLHLHMASPVCKLPSSYMDTAILDLGHTLIQSDFILHCLHCKLHLTLFISAKFYL